jgi:hypothetical protein
MRTMALLSCLVLLGAAVLAAQAQKPLTNDDVVQMVKAGFDEPTILKAIESGTPDFDTSVQGLIALKQAGISQTIISGMLAATKANADKKEAEAKAAEARAAEAKAAEARAAEAKAAEARAAEAKAAAEQAALEKAAADKAAAEKNKDVPDDVGVYAKVKGELAEVYAEVVNWKSGGVGERMLTLGATKGHVNGYVSKPKSKLQLGTPIDFIIKCKEGETPSEYQLLKLDEKGDRREFRAITGGVYHSSGGADKNAMPFDFEKIAPRTYRLKLGVLKHGEYGFLPPGGGSVGGVGGGASGKAVEGGSMSGGKLYTFGVIE